MASFNSIAAPFHNMICWVDMIDSGSNGNLAFLQRYIYAFHRKGAKAAESDYFLFAVERTANKKTHALRAIYKSVVIFARIAILTN
jgi:hypothetical protein